MNILEAKNISHTYTQGKKNVNILDGLNLTVNENETIAIIGASGSGKSTLLHILGGLDEPTSGEVQICDKAFSTESPKEKGNIRNHHLGFVYQFHHLLPEFSAIENVMMPLLIRKFDRKSAVKKALSLLDKVGIAQRAEHKPSELSGGERQRVAIARAMVTNPDCILADEPTGNLDQENATKIMDLLFNIQQSEKTSLIIVTHDKNIAKQMQKTYQLIDKKLEQI